MTHQTRPRAVMFARGSWSEARRVAGILRRETVGGALLLAATVVAIAWANSPQGAGYEALRHAQVGPAALGLRLSLAEWAADGLLAIFFFVAGLELKREFVSGDLRDLRRAALPIAAAVGGMIVPAVAFVAIARTGGAGALRGWAIPTATDIAFALAVLAVISTHLPSALRTFLLTLAVVDDLLAIVVIATFYTSGLALAPLAAGAAALAGFTALVQRRVGYWWLLLPLAGAAWAFVHASGVHATVAGVLLGFAVPVRPAPGPSAGGSPAGPDLAERLEHLWRPVSSGVAVPLFAFFSAGVAVGGPGGLARALSDPVALGVVTGLVVGKTVGIFSAAYGVAYFTAAELDDELSWADVLGLAMLGGVGFTVSLLIGELAFGAGSDRDDHVKLAVLAGSVLAAVAATGVLRLRNRTYRRISERETVDADADGVPDVYQP